MDGLSGSRGKGSVDIEEADIHNMRETFNLHI